MYYLFSMLGTALGLDALTFGLVFVMALIGSQILKFTVKNLLLTIVFFPILALTSALANYLGAASGLTVPFVVPYDQLDLIRYISVRDFITVMTVTFTGMLVGLAGILALYRQWGHEA